MCYNYDSYLGEFTPVVKVDENIHPDPKTFAMVFVNTQAVWPFQIATVDTKSLYTFSL